VTEYTSLAFLGPEGTYSHRASLVLPAQERLAKRSIRAVFDAVASGEAAAGVVPGENVFEGAVHETLDLLLVRTLVVSGEVVLPIHHWLLGHRGAGIQRVYSHPQALAQCGAWLDAHLPDALRVECTSTTEASAMAVSDPRSAAIAGTERPGLEVLERNLGLSENLTRFFVLSKAIATPTGHDRALVAFLAPHRPGALHACLGPFAAAGVNLCRLEHRPARAEAWTYHFIAEIEGHPEDPATHRALEDLRRCATDVRLLGAWPVARG
jgi:chorismate mutase/prephenate dehydratase